MKNALSLVHPDRRARFALQSRCASGATFMPRPKPAVRAPVAEPEQLSPSRTPEQLLAKCQTQLWVFQLLDDLAAAGAVLPTRKAMAARLEISVDALAGAIRGLESKGMIQIERNGSGHWAAVQILASGKWVRA